MTDRERVVMLRQALYRLLCGVADELAEQWTSGSFSDDVQAAYAALSETGED